MKNDDFIILLVHAYTGSKKDVENLKKFLEKNGFLTYSMTLKGHDEKTLKNILEVNPDDWYLQVKQEVLNLKSIYNKKIVVMGLSLGGILACKIAENIEICACGCFCSPIIPLENNLDHLIENMISYEMYNIKKYNVETNFDELLINIKKQLKKLEAFIYKVEEDLDYIKIPVYIAQGEKDELFNFECSNLLYNKLKNQTKVTYKLFEDSGHVITTSKQAKQFEESVLDFLQNL